MTIFGPIVFYLQIPHHERFAGIAQLVEQLICNQQVVGSNPTAGLKKLPASRSSK
jgi:hypothetical protein